MNLFMIASTFLSFCELIVDHLIVSLSRLLCFIEFQFNNNHFQKKEEEEEEKEKELISKTHEQVKSAQIRKMRFICK